jgi:predicted HTH transcriptional regulator
MVESVIETMVHRNQAEYYKAINQSTADASSNAFIHYMLCMIHETVQEAATVSEKTSEKTSEKILRYIKEDASITIAGLAQKTGLTTRTIERNLKTLQQQGRVLRIGPDKSGSWKVLDHLGSKQNGDVH